MPRVLTFSLCSLVLASLIMIGAGNPALARNVPGSAQQGVAKATEVATSMIVRSITDNMRPMRGSGVTVQISTSGETVPTGISFGMGGVTPLSFSLEYRDVALSDLEGSVYASTLILGHRANDRVLVFGGLIAEEGDLRTPFNAGTVKYDGVGLALGLDYRVSDQVFLTAVGGAMSLNYDVTRSAGAITGSFNAKRQFIDISGDYLTRAGGADLRFGLGMLYARQGNDGYTESGGAVVGAATQDQLSAMLEMRSTWGTPGELRPYVDLSAQGKLSDNPGVPAIVGLSLETDWTARLAVGAEQVLGRSSFSAVIGANFGQQRFEGLDAKLNYAFRF